jgi:hypothetical protein
MQISPASVGKKFDSDGTENSWHKGLEVNEQRGMLQGVPRFVFDVVHSLLFIPDAQKVENCAFFLISFPLQHNDPFRS